MNIDKCAISCINVMSNDPKEVNKLNTAIDDGMVIGMIMMLSVLLLVIVLRNLARKRMNRLQ